MPCRMPHLAAAKPPAQPGSATPQAVCLRSSGFADPHLESDPGLGGGASEPARQEPRPAGLYHHQRLTLELFVGLIGHDAARRGAA
jgi:hypothetical protein